MIKKQETMTMTRPLEGLFVLDLSQLLPGGLCTQILGDLGARVVKVEPPGSGDGFRLAPPLVNGMGSYFAILNGNKEGMTLNLKTPRGREILSKLARRADVLVESANPGVMASLGLDYEEVKKTNERIVYCSLTGFGQEGPYRNRPAHDLDFLALSGVLDLIGTDGGPPAMPAVQVAGTGAGLTAALGILAALMAREKTGRGQWLDMAVLDSLTPFLGLVMSQFMAGLPGIERGKTLVGGGYAFYNVYETRDGKYIALGCLEEKFWQGFCRAVGREDLAREHMVPSPRREEIIAEVRALMKERTRDAWLGLFENHRICFSPVHTLEEALDDPQVRFRNLWSRLESPGGEPFPQQAPLVRLSGDGPNTRSAPPQLGEHTEKILAELGYGAGEIARFYREGIV